jgi:hypothetical protein
MAFSNNYMSNCQIRCKKINLHHTKETFVCVISGTLLRIISLPHIPFQKHVASLFSVSILLLAALRCLLFSLLRQLICIYIFAPAGCYFVADINFVSERRVDTHTQIINNSLIFMALCRLWIWCAYMREI